MQWGSEKFLNVLHNALSMFLGIFVNEFINITNFGQYLSTGQKGCQLCQLLSSGLSNFVSEFLNVLKIYQLLSMCLLTLTLIVGSSTLSMGSSIS